MMNGVKVAEKVGLVPILPPRGWVWWRVYGS